MVEAYDAHFQALQDPEKFTLVVGEKAESIEINKGVLRLKSDTLAKLADKFGGSLHLPDCPIFAVKRFVLWCYQNHLEVPLTAASPDSERRKWKACFIDLWLFALKADVPKLQNDTMKALLNLFTANPNLLHQNDFGALWTHASDTAVAVELKQALVYTLVAQLEEGKGGVKGSITDFVIMAGLDGFFPMVYEALKFWGEFEMPKKKVKGQRKWQLVVQDEEVREKFFVDESVKTALSTPMTTPMKRKWKWEGDGSGKKAKGFTPGEVICLDDD